MNSKKYFNVRKLHQIGFNPFLSQLRKKLATHEIQEEKREEGFSVKGGLYRCYFGATYASIFIESQMCLIEANNLLNL